MLTKTELDNFTGTEHHYEHALSGYVYTDGVKYMAEKAGAYWLIDKILTITKHFKDEKIKEKMFEFGVWTLYKNPDESALLECGDGYGARLYKENIKWINFPMDKIILWSIGGVLILPNEY